MNKDIVYHVTAECNLESILTNGLIPQVGYRSKQLGEPPCIFFFEKMEAVEDAVLNWLGDELENEHGENLELVCLEILIESDKKSDIDCAKYETLTYSAVSPECIVSISLI